MTGPSALLRSFRAVPLLAALLPPAAPALADPCETVATALRADRVLPGLPADRLAPFAALGIAVAGWEELPAEPTALRRLDLGAGPVTVLTQRPGPLRCPRLAVPGALVFDGGDCAWTPRFLADGGRALLWRAAWPDDTLYRQEGGGLRPVCTIRRRFEAPRVTASCPDPACAGVQPLLPRLIGEPRAVLGGRPAPLPRELARGAFGPAGAVTLDFGGPVVLTRWREGPQDALAFRFSRPVPGAEGLDSGGLRLFTGLDSIVPVSVAGADLLAVVEQRGPAAEGAFLVSLHGWRDGALRQIGGLTLGAALSVAVERHSPQR
ncbi:MAG: hypothetical protein OHK0024_07730 [Thalassobaculales bacterium]